MNNPYQAIARKRRQQHRKNGMERLPLDRKPDLLCRTMPEKGKQQSAIQNQVVVDSAVSDKSD